MGHVLQMVKQGILASIGWDNTSRRRNAFPEGRRFSHVRLCVTPWTIACQAPMSTGFSRQEYWSEVPCPSPGDVPNPRIKPTSLGLLCWQVGSLPLAPHGKPPILLQILVISVFTLLFQIYLARALFY